MPNITKIIVHCSASPQGRGDNAETIHRWHKENSWSGIGYHAVILEDGTIENGRPDFWTGAHARGMNTGTLGVCLIGLDTFTNAQYDALRAYLHKKMLAYGLEVEDVIGHYEVPRANRTCPNFDMKEFRENL